MPLPKQKGKVFPTKITVRVRLQLVDILPLMSITKTGMYIKRTLVVGLVHFGVFVKVFGAGVEFILCIL